MVFLDENGGVGGEGAGAKYLQGCLTNLIIRGMFKNYICEDAVPAVCFWRPFDQVIYLSISMRLYYSVLMARKLTHLQNLTPNAIFSSKQDSYTRNCSMLLTNPSSYERLIYILTFHDFYSKTSKI